MWQMYLGVALPIVAFFIVASLQLPVAASTHTTSNSNSNSAGLELYVFNNTALGMSALPSHPVTVPNLAGAVAVAPLQSALVTGRVSSPAGTDGDNDGSGGGINFSCLTDGMLRLWVDDHLVLDDTPKVGQTAPRLITSWITLPPFTESRPFRLEYTRIHGFDSESEDAINSNTSSGVVKLMWNVPTNHTVVPSSAFVIDTSTVRADYAALRTRLYEPVVPWQTYYATSMTSHVLQPTGLVLHATLLDIGTVRKCKRETDLLCLVVFACQ